MSFLYYSMTGGMTNVLSCRYSQVDILVNNAGLALGTSSVVDNNIEVLMLCICHLICMPPNDLYSEARPSIETKRKKE